MHPDCRSKGVATRLDRKGGTKAWRDDKSWVCCVWFIDYVYIAIQRGAGHFRFIFNQKSWLRVCLVIVGGGQEFLDSDRACGRRQGAVLGVDAFMVCIGLEVL